MIINKKGVFLNDGLTPDGIHLVSLYANFMMAAGCCNEHNTLVLLGALPMSVTEEEYDHNGNNAEESSKESVTELPNEIR